MKLRGKLKKLTSWCHETHSLLQKSTFLSGRPSPSFLSAAQSQSSVQELLEENSSQKSILKLRETFCFHTFDFSDNLLHFFLLFADEVCHRFSWSQRDVTCYRLMVSRSVHVDSGQKFGFFWPTPGLVTNSILICWLFTIKDWCEQVHFWQTHIQGSRQMFPTVSWASAPTAAHLTVSLFLSSSGSNSWGESRALEVHIGGQVKCGFYGVCAYFEYRWQLVRADIDDSVVHELHNAVQVFIRHVFQNHYRMLARDHGTEQTLKCKRRCSF